MKRSFNKYSYDLFDNESKIKLVELIEKTSHFKLNDDLDDERYKDGDVEFINPNNNKILFELEVRRNFDDIINTYKTIHIPIRKQYCPADYYIVWKSDYNQFILISKGTIDKYRDNIITIKCKNEINREGESYIEEFLDIPKEETQWYVVGKNYKLIKLDY